VEQEHLEKSGSTDTGRSPDSTERDIRKEAADISDKDLAADTVRRLTLEDSKGQLADQDLVLLAWLHVELGQILDATRLFERLRTSGRSGPDVASGYALTLFWTDLPGKAFIVADEALAQYPEDPGLSAMMLRLLASKAQFQEAHKHLSAAANAIDVLRPALPLMLLVWLWGQQLSPTRLLRIDRLADEWHAVVFTPWQRHMISEASTDTTVVKEARLRADRYARARATLIATASRVFPFVLIGLLAFVICCYVGVALAYTATEGGALPSRAYIVHTVIGLVTLAMIALTLLHRNALRRAYTLVGAAIFTASALFALTMIKNVGILSTDSGSGTVSGLQSQFLVFSGIAILIVAGQAAFSAVPRSIKRMEPVGNLLAEVCDLIYFTSYSSLQTSHELRLYCADQVETVARSLERFFWSGSAKRRMTMDVAMSRSAKAVVGSVRSLKRQLLVPDDKGQREVATSANVLLSHLVEGTLRTELGEKVDEDEISSTYSETRQAKLGLLGRVIVPLLAAATIALVPMFEGDGQAWAIAVLVLLAVLSLLKRIDPEIDERIRSTKYLTSVAMPGALSQQRGA
jgi:hypothetical protein